jgi:trans-aconitate 2-methyltransferase
VCRDGSGLRRLTSSSADPWNPEQYERFRAEREQPFWDLLPLIDTRPGGRVVDLGCGTGVLTRELHRTVQARDTTGVDQSRAMLHRAAEINEPGLHFTEGDIAVWSPPEAVDVVFSNAALQWVDDHERLFARLVSFLAPGGVLAAQVPANYDHPSHTIAAEVALEEPFATATGGYARVAPVLAPEAYVQLLHDLGLRSLHVRLQVYCHELESTADLVEWTRGTLLTDYQPRMPETMFDDYVRRYRERLFERLGERGPYLFAFKRILMRGVAPG